MSEQLAERIKRYLTSAQVAERYQAGESTIRYWRQIGYGPTYIKVGRRALYDPEELDRWDAQQERGAAA
ncbi:helix-turn-helix transcriptional regulator [Actinacidiphila sp. ITFR-21]|uniref:helix-turn-helix transcriptional regulator n=1 Tax=Actinacidiphila sp. ITFR-21 TaxID=3075199 RepID=UPI00288A4F2A|nr:helix-turn-helix domain-containing protein [Streptomyces sp. ITFR-21]WNI15219.1 helix-turn-helix domain-containing protein [Streptomyces sp. ITFR-21]